MKINIFQDLPKDHDLHEITDVIFRDPNHRIERIVSHGECSPDGFWYDQAEDEFVVLLSGEAVLQFEQGEEIFLRKGDCLHIPAHQKHRVLATSKKEDSIWLAFFWKTSS